MVIVDGMDRQKGSGIIKKEVWYVHCLAIGAYYNFYFAIVGSTQY